jgi:pyruvate/oxaloacetate carboxyltransferase
MRQTRRGELCYTISPVHTVENFVKMGVELEKMGCDSLGIKDMSGILQPRIAYRSGQGTQGQGRHSHHAAHARHGRAGRGQLSGGH